VRKLEKGTNWEGVMDKEIATDKEKTIQQWIEENKE
jgi:hypothetical protein